MVSTPLETATTQGASPFRLISTKNSSPLQTAPPPLILPLVGLAMATSALVEETAPLQLTSLILVIV